MECQGLNSEPCGEEGCGDVFVLGKQIGPLVWRSAPSPRGKPAAWLGPGEASGPFPACPAAGERVHGLAWGLAFLSGFLSIRRSAMFFWPRSPLRFLWGNGNATKLLVAIPMFHSWKRGSHLLHELLGIGPFCSSAQAQWVVFVTLGIAINGLSEVIISPGMGSCF